MKSKKIIIGLVILSIACAFTCSQAEAQGFQIPKFNFVSKAETPDDVTLTLQLFILFTVLSFAPAIFLLTTSFARVMIVLSFLKKAAGLQDIPNQLVAGLALFVTAMVMMPVWSEINERALQPYLKREITQTQATICVNKSRIQFNGSFKHFSRFSIVFFCIQK